MSLLMVLNSTNINQSIQALYLVNNAMYYKENYKKSNTSNPFMTLNVVLKYLESCIGHMVSIVCNLSIPPGVQTNLTVLPGYIDEMCTQDVYEPSGSLKVDVALGGSFFSVDGTLLPFSQLSRPFLSNSHVTWTTISRNYN